MHVFNTMNAAHHKTYNTFVIKKKIKILKFVFKFLCRFGMSYRCSFFCFCWNAHFQLESRVTLSVAKHTRQETTHQKKDTNKKLFRFEREKKAHFIWNVKIMICYRSFHSMGHFYSIYWPHKPRLGYLLHDPIYLIVLSSFQTIGHNTSLNRIHVFLRGVFELLVWWPVVTFTTGYSSSSKSIKSMSHWIGSRRNVQLYASLVFRTSFHFISIIRNSVRSI